jgi:hypothetical protein
MPRKDGSLTFAEKMRNFPESGIVLQCHKCDYMWNYEGGEIEKLDNDNEIARASCPNCLIKVNIAKHRVDE